MLFHALHCGHFPSHFGEEAPQDWQMYCVLDLAN